MNRNGVNILTVYQVVSYPPARQGQRLIRKRFRQPRRPPILCLRCRSARESIVKKSGNLACSAYCGDFLLPGHPFSRCLLVRLEMLGYQYI